MFLKIMNDQMRSEMGHQRQLERLREKSLEPDYSEYTYTQSRQNSFLPDVNISYITDYNFNHNHNATTPPRNNFHRNQSNSGNNRNVHFNSNSYNNINYNYNSPSYRNDNKTHNYNHSGTATIGADIPMHFPQIHYNNSNSISNFSFNNQIAASIHPIQPTSSLPIAKRIPPMSQMTMYNAKKQQRPHSARASISLNKISRNRLPSTSATNASNIPALGNHYSASLPKASLDNNYKSLTPEPPQIPSQNVNRGSDHSSKAAARRARARDLGLTLAVIHSGRNSINIVGGGVKDEQKLPSSNLIEPNQQSQSKVNHLLIQHIQNKFENKESLDLKNNSNSIVNNEKHMHPQTEPEPTNNVNPICDNQTNNKINDNTVNTHEKENIRANIETNENKSQRDRATAKTKHRRRRSTHRRSKAHANLEIPSAKDLLKSQHKAEKSVEEHHIEWFTRIGHMFSHMHVCFS